MVDIFTHQILDMIDSRDYETVCEWLKTYPNLRVISRDGSVTYNNAITNAHPRALQISDRFHLLKNLTSYVTEYLKKRLKPQVAYFGHIRTLIPTTCGQHFGIIRTA